MKISLLRAALPFLFVALGLLLAPAAHATDASEPPDFPDTPAAANTYTLTAGTNTFSGTTLGNTSDQDYFKITVPAGMRVTQITPSTNPSGSTNSFVPLTVPLNAGTYTAGFTPGTHTVDINWSVVFTVTAVPDYDVITSNGVLTLTNNTNNNDSLTVSPASAGANIQFLASGRTFSVNGAANITGSANVALAGISSVVVITGSGNESVKVSAFTNSTFPSLTINGGTGADSVAFNGNLTFGSNSSLTVDLTQSSAGVVSLNNGVVLNVGPMGGGAISILCSQSVSLDIGAILETFDGNIDIEANQQSTPTTGKFSGVSLSPGGTPGAAIKITDANTTGYLTVKGTGGNDPSGSQNGVSLTNGAQISNAATGDVFVTGFGGASTGSSNFGVAVSQSAAITAPLGGVGVTGTGGSASGKGSGVGVSVRSGGMISGGSNGGLTVSGVGGAVQAGSGFNDGVLVSDTNSLITSTSGLQVNGTAGPGASFGLDVSASGKITTTTNGGRVYLLADSITLDSTASISTIGAASFVSFYPIASSTQINIGGPHATGVLGITNGYLQQVSTALLIFNTNAGDITIGAPVTPTAGTSVQLYAGGAIHATASGTDLSLASNALSLTVGTLSMPISGAAPDTGYPQLNVAGNVNLNGVALDISGTTDTAAAQGDTFTIVKNSGSGTTTSGTFAGLAEGAYLVWPGNPAFAAQITYQGGSGGHDVVLTLVPVAQALTVNNTSNGTSVGSLQTVLAFAAAHPGADTITFGPGVNGGTITLSGPANGYAITIADSSPVTIDGTGLANGLTISGAGTNGNFGLFQVNQGASLTLRNLTLANGGGSAFASADGNGGAISNAGTSTLIGCTLTGNSAGAGGALFNAFSATQLTLVQCTLTGNLALHSGGAIASGQPLTVSQCTISGNTARQSGGGIEAGGGTLNLNNSIVAGNLPALPGADPDASFNTSLPLTVSGANIVQSIGSGFSTTGSGTIINAAPLLAPLGSYGGPTQTMPPLPGSPAIDAGVIMSIPSDPANGAVFTTDQRGFQRISNGIVDIGAVETSALQVTTLDDANTTTSLRGVIFNATDPATTTITFAPGLAGNTIALSSVGGQIMLNKNFAIDASNLAGGITLSGAGANGNFRLLNVPSGETVILRNLTLANGGGSNFQGDGGALINSGTLTATNCVFTGNESVGNNGGGAIFNGGTLTLNQCSLTGNSISFVGGGAIHNAGTLVLNQCTLTSNNAYQGGAVENFSTSLLNQCTLAGNTASAYGGGIENQGSLTLTQCTVAGNHQTLTGGAGGGINHYLSSSTLALTNTLIAGNTTPGAGPDVNDTGGTVTASHCLIGVSSSSGVSNGTNGNITDVNPLLAPLNNYGGPTLTMALEPNSPARNVALVLSPALTTDQRGFPIVGLPDIGAYEAGTLNLNYNAYIYETLPAGTAVAQYAPTADYDGDGVSNYNEFLDQTSAADPTIYLRITSFTRSGNTVSVTFPAVSGKNYYLEGSPDLVSWTSLAGPFSGTGSAMASYTFTNGLPTRYFFHIIIKP